MRSAGQSVQKYIHATVGPERVYTPPKQNFNVRPCLKDRMLIFYGLRVQEVCIPEKHRAWWGWGCNRNLVSVLSLIITSLSLVTCQCQSSFVIRRMALGYKIRDSSFKKQYSFGLLIWFGLLYSFSLLIIIIEKTYYMSLSLCKIPLAPRTAVTVGEGSGMKRRGSVWDRGVSVL